MTPHLPDVPLCSHTCSLQVQTYNLTDICNSRGLGLPDRDYYLKPSFASRKAAYQTYVAKLLAQVGWPDPETNAAAVVAFETRVADASWTRAKRDPRG